MSAVQRFCRVRPAIVSILAVGLVAFFASPASAAGEDTTVSADGKAITARVDSGPGKRPAGPKCNWGKSIENGAYAEVEVDDPDNPGQKLVIQMVVEEGPGDPLPDGLVGPPAPKKETTIDPDQRSGAPSDEVFYEEIEEGSVSVNGENWRVFTGVCEGIGEEVAFVPPAVASLFPGAEAELTKYITDPELILHPKDEDNDWTFVQTAVDFRTTVESVQPVEIWLDSGGPESVRKWIEITATPTFLVFKPGDPIAGLETEVRCPVENGNATAAYNPETPLENCHYIYRNASSTVEGNAFKAELSLEWSVTYQSSEGPGTLEVEPTTIEEDVRVAEIKAVTKDRDS